MVGTPDTDDDDRLTYAEAGVDIAQSEAATAALADAIADLNTDAYAGVLDIGDRYLALATDGVGTKLLVAEAVERFDTIGIDCIAMNVNDLVAMGVEPVGFVDYLALEEPDEQLTEAIGVGLATGASQANIALLGGETAVLPEVVTGFDLAGACVGIAGMDELFPGKATPGDMLVGFPATGIHSNGLTLARKAIEREYAYSDPFPANPEMTIGEVLLEPTALYTELLDSLRNADAHACAHITGGGWTNLKRLGDHQYLIDDPFSPHPIFTLIQDVGEITDAEMHRTFNMGTGFIASVPAESADELTAATNGRIIGRVETGSAINIRGLTL